MIGLLWSITTKQHLKRIEVIQTAENNTLQYADTQ